VLEVSISSCVYFALAYSNNDPTAHFSKTTISVNMGKDHPDANLHPEATGLAAKTVQVSISIPRFDPVD
jgi:hypothetical protein